MLFLVRRCKTQIRIDVRVFLQLTDGLGNRAVEVFIDIEILVFKKYFASYASIYVIYFLILTIANGDFK